MHHFCTFVSFYIDALCVFLFYLQITSSLGQVKREFVAIGDLARVIKLEQNTSKPCCAKDDDEVMIIDDEDLKTAEMSSIQHEGVKVKAKLLQFHQNYRPAYFGSWRKKSTRIGPRTPFKKDEVWKLKDNIKSLM